MLGLGLAVHKQIPQRNIVKDGLVLYLDGKDFRNSPPTTSWRDRSGQNNNATPSNFGYINNIPASTVTDFQGKIAGDLNSNANVAKWSKSTSLQTPKGSFTEWATADYNLMNTLNGSSRQVTSTNVNEIPQMLKQFNVISAVEKMLGKPIPTVDGTTASKINWIKSNVSKIIANAYIDGVCPTGNKAYLKVFSITNNTWSGNGQNTASSITKTSIGLDTAYNDIANCTDSNGMVSFLAYTDPARSTDSTLLVLSGHGLSDADIVENTTRNAGVVIHTNTVNVNVLSHNATITGQVAGDSIDKFHYIGTSKTAEIGTTETLIKITNHGLSSSHAHWIKNISKGGLMSKVTVTDANTLTLVGGVTNSTTTITGQTTGDSIWLFPYTGTQTAESTVIPSTVYTDYISLEIDFADQSSGSDGKGNVIFDSVDDKITIPNSSNFQSMYINGVAITPTGTITGARTVKNIVAYNRVLSDIEVTRNLRALK